ncbi:hypothetical protein N9Z51_00060 [bacterium]|nr:hypothetical protein [bacterium]
MLHLGGYRTCHKTRGNCNVDKFVEQPTWDPDHPKGNLEAPTYDCDEKFVLYVTVFMRILSGRNVFCIHFLDCGWWRPCF